MTDPFATSRNGHPLENMYDPDYNTLDIRYNGLYPSNVLSNLYEHPFTFDGVKCGGMEGFLQSLKYSDIKRQRRICAMHGGSAKEMSKSDWQLTQTLWWKGRPIQRESPEFYYLVSEAYEEMARENPLFTDALMASGDMKLVHTIGISDPKKTILTDSEFCNILTNLRQHYTSDFRIRSFKVYFFGAIMLLPALYCFKMASEGNPTNQMGCFVSGLMFVLLVAVFYSIMIGKSLKFKRLRAIAKHVLNK